MLLPRYCRFPRTISQDLHSLRHHFQVLWESVKKKSKIKRSLATAFESYFCECFPVAIGTRSFRWKITWTGSVSILRNCFGNNEFSSLVFWWKINMSMSCTISYVCWRRYKWCGSRQVYSGNSRWRIFLLRNENHQQRQKEHVCTLFTRKNLGFHQLYPKN